MNAGAGVPSLSTQQLLYLRAAARAATWTDAAADLGVTQSALSQGIAELERRLGLELFERRGRRRVLSTAGQEVLTRADGVLAQAADLGRVADQLRHGTRGTYRLGLIDSAAVATCRPALAAARSLAGDSLHVIVDTSVPLTQAVQRGELDLAVVVGNNAAIRSGGSGRAAESSVTTKLVAEESLVVVAPHRVATTAVGDPGQWGPWVMPPDGSTTRILIDEALRARGADPATTLESSNPTVLLSMVALGLGWAVLPAHMEAEGGTRSGPPPGVVIGDELVRRPLMAVTRTGAPADPRTRAFLAAVDR